MNVTTKWKQQVARHERTSCFFNDKYVSVKPNEEKHRMRLLIFGIGRIATDYFVSTNLEYQHIACIVFDYCFKDEPDTLISIKKSTIALPQHYTSRVVAQNVIFFNKPVDQFTRTIFKLSKNKCNHTRNVCDAGYYNLQLFVIGIDRIYAKNDYSLDFAMEERKHIKRKERLTKIGNMIALNGHVNDVHNSKSKSSHRGNDYNDDNKDEGGIILGTNVHKDIGTNILERGLTCINTTKESKGLKYEIHGFIAKHESDQWFENYFCQGISIVQHNGKLIDNIKYNCGNGYSSFRGFSGRHNIEFCWDNGFLKPPKPKKGFGPYSLHNVEFLNNNDNENDDKNDDDEKKNSTLDNFETLVEIRYDPKTDQLRFIKDSGVNSVTRNIIIGQSIKDDKEYHSKNRNYFEKGVFKLDNNQFEYFPVLTSLGCSCCNQGVVIGVTRE